MQRSHRTSTGIHRLNHRRWLCRILQIETDRNKSQKNSRSTAFISALLSFIMLWKDWTRWVSSRLKPLLAHCGYQKSIGLLLDTASVEPRLNRSNSWRSSHRFALEMQCQHASFGSRTSTLAALREKINPPAPKVSLGQSWSELAQVGPKWAPVRPNLRPETANFDPSRLLVGPSRPASFLSVLFPGYGRFSSRSDSNLQSLQLQALSTSFNIEISPYSAGCPN